MRVSPPTHPDIGISSIRKSELPGLSKSGIRPRRAFYRRFFGDKGVRKFADCADRRGPAYESLPARMSGNRVIGLVNSGGAFSGVSVARFSGGSWLKRGPKIDQLRRPAGAHIWEPPRP